MATLSVQVVDRAGDGLTPAFAAATVSGDEFPNSGREWLVVKNGSGGSITVTASTPQTVAGLAVAEEAYAVPASGECYIGPFPPGTFNNTSTGRVALTYSGVTSLTVGVFRLGA